jgi:hypothetical protein
MARAELLVSLLERFPGYTLGSLLKEDAELLRMVKMTDRARATERGDDGDAWSGE